MNRNDETAGLGERLYELLHHFEPCGADYFGKEDLARVAEEFLAEAASQQWVAKQMSEMKIKTMDFRNGIAMELEPARDMAAAWVAAARALLMGGENYNEMTYTETREDLGKASYSMDISIAELPERYTLTVQRVALGKLTPHEARRKAEAERDKLLKLITDHVVTSNDFGGVDANDLASAVQREGFTLPDGE